MLKLSKYHLFKCHCLFFFVSFESSMSLSISMFVQPLFIDLLTVSVGLIGIGIIGTLFLGMRILSSADDIANSFTTKYTGYGWTLLFALYVLRITRASSGYNKDIYTKISSPL